MTVPTIDVLTSAWFIVLLAFSYGRCTSIQYASMYADAMIEGIHRAVFFGDALTLFSKLVFRTLKAGGAEM
ncbi:MAG TPA: hypothetical protein VFW30_00880 [Bryocella sp.]|nr:hypothetical protein [Bryocella sp.]